MEIKSVQIDLAKLGLRLSRDMGRQIGPGEVHAWLNGRGLKMAGDSWSCSGEKILQLFQPGELVRVSRAGTEDGVTFIENEDTARS